MVEATNKFDGFKGNGMREGPVVILVGNRDDHRQHKREDASPVCGCVVRALLRAVSTWVWTGGVFIAIGSDEGGAAN